MRVLRSFAALQHHRASHAGAIRSKGRLFSAALAFACAGLTAATGCSATDSETTVGGPNGQGATGSGASGGSNGRGGAGGSIVGSGGSNTGSGGTDTGVCKADPYTAQGGVDMYVMFDESLSMVLSLAWVPVTDAFKAFINSPQSAGIGVGIQYFGEACDAAGYARPRVPIAPLPGNAQAVLGSLPANPSRFSTPSLPALQGAIEHAKSWQTSHPDRKVVVLFVTDGEPNGCNSDIANVSAAAAQGFTGMPSIQTYVLGVGLTLTNLNSIAQAGGTNQAFISDATSAAALTSALLAIRTAALPCDYALPGADPTKVNLDFTPNPNDPATTKRIPFLKDASECAANPAGWYYDNPSAPTRLVLCTQTCSLFKQSPAANVNVLLGCPTEGPA